MLLACSGALRSWRLSGARPRYAMTSSAAAANQGEALLLTSSQSSHVDESVAATTPSMIDESLFNKTINLLALRVPAPLCSRIMAALRPTTCLFTHSRLPTVVDDDSPPPPPPVTEEQKEERSEPSITAQQQRHRPSTKLVLLAPSLNAPASFPAPLSSLVAEHSLTTTRHAVHLTYQMHSLEQVLTAVLPAGVPAPSSFETVGHLAHVNLLPCHLPHRRLIGAAIVSHSPGIRCVVNKLSAISDEFRVLPMEVIAGEEGDTVTEVREHGCLFRFDYRLVYWNSRLATEHRRLVDLVQPHETVVDMFAGIGPFIIPIAKKGTGEGRRLLANDKNSHSFDALQNNIELNGVSGGVTAFKFDAREFIALVKQQLRQGQLSHIDHVIMNLPASAITFLDCLRGMYSSRAAAESKHGEEQKSVTVSAHHPNRPCPVVHVYCFSNADDKVADVMNRIQQTIAHTLPAPKLTTDVRGTHAGAKGAVATVAVKKSEDRADERRSAAADRKRKREEKQHATAAQSRAVDWSAPSVHFVRNVAPNKDMLCVSFRLPEEVAYDAGDADATVALESKR